MVSANCARELEELLMAAEDENEVLHKEIERLDEMVMRWFKAASPYATPGSLEAALKRFHARSEYCVVCNPRPADAAPSPPPQKDKS